jgi:hypothetical protein
VYIPKGNSFDEFHIPEPVTTENNEDCRKQTRKKDRSTIDDGISGVPAAETIHPSFIGLHGFVVFFRFLLFSTSFTRD